MAEEADSGRKALESYKANTPDAVILDLRLGEESGLEVLQHIKALDPHAAVFMVTAHGDLEDAVAGFRLGLTDFFRKPIDFEALQVALRYRLESKRLRDGIERAREQDESEHRVIGSSASMKDALRVLQKVATSNTTTVLLQGESGSGKDLFAKELHRLSARREGPFIAVNCAAVPDQLLESELFGHERGAFTDARSMKRGVFELADNGTLYLDEIGEMPLPLQAKLLRVIETLTFRRIGGTQDLTVDTRIVAASNRNLEQAVDQGAFRADLFFRLGVIQIRLPALRERREDIPALASYFVEKLARRLRGRAAHLGPGAMDALARYDWPGNVRELRNCIERALILEDGDTITTEYLPVGAMPAGASRAAGSPGAAADPATPFVLPAEGASLERVEESLVRQAMALANNNQTRAAKLLDISRDALRYKLKKFGLGGEGDAGEKGE
jgi:two-component system, NtrC family, response regulator AtoC